MEILIGALFTIFFIIGFILAFIVFKYFDKKEYRASENHLENTATGNPKNVTPELMNEWFYGGGNNEE